MEEGDRAPSLPDTRETQPNNAEASRLIDDILEMAGELGQKGIEHRTQDIRDAIPIWGSFRSHKLATREAEVISNIHADVAKLEQVAQGTGLNIAPLKELALQLSPPKGFTKVMGSIFPGARSFHRGWIAPKLEALREEASRLRRQMRDGATPSRAA